MVDHVKLTIAVEDVLVQIDSHDLETELRSRGEFEEDEEREADAVLRQIFERMGRGENVTEDLRRYAWDVFGINALPARIA